MSTDSPALPPVAEQIADAALSVPGVTGLHGGLFGEIATYLPGGRVSGVVVSDNHGEVHLIVDAGHDLRGVAREVAEVAAEIAGYPVNVTVEDISTGAPAPNSTPEVSAPELPASEGQATEGEKR